MFEPLIRECSHMGIYTQLQSARIPKDNDMKYLVGTADLFKYTCGNFNHYVRKEG